MMFMNEYEIEIALSRFANDETPNLFTAANTLYRLKEWTNDNSDGWAYWPKPCRAAKRLQELLQAADRFNPVDCTDAALKAALTPIKAFLTSHKVDHAKIIAPATDEGDLIHFRRLANDADRAWSA